MPFHRYLYPMNWTLFESEDIGRLWRTEENVLLEGKADRKRICIARYNSTLYAFDARCPHAGGPLVDGYLNDQAEVVCPWHRFGFQLTNGQCSSGGYFIDTYPVRLKGRQLWIGLHNRPWWKFWASTT